MNGQTVKPDDRPPKACQGEFLSEFLADQSVVCDGCGYDLRGCREIYCPECGRVIARPSLEQQERARSPEFNCRLCGTRNSHAGTQCEACGEPRLGTNLTASPSWGIWRGIPKSIRLWALVAAVQSLAFIVLAGVAWSNPAARSPGAFALSAMLSAGGVLIAIAWRCRLRRVAKVSLPARTWMIHGAGVACGVLVVLAWAV